MRIDAIPGFEFTGELRHPAPDEWYWDSFEPLQWRSRGSIGRRLILRKLRSTDLGDYELTGEFRAAGIDEPYLGWEVAATPATDRSTVRFGPTARGSAIHILREKRA